MKNKYLYQIGWMICIWGIVISSMLYFSAWIFSDFFNFIAYSFCLIYFAFCLDYFIFKYSKEVYKNENKNINGKK
jgi:hypothetical protein